MLRSFANLGRKLQMTKRHQPAQQQLNVVFVYSAIWGSKPEISYSFKIPLIKLIPKVYHRGQVKYSRAHESNKSSLLRRLGSAYFIFFCFISLCTIKILGTAIL